jgi:hypothetical protein
MVGACPVPYVGVAARVAASGCVNGSGGRYGDLTISTTDVGQRLTASAPKQDHSVHVPDHGPLYRDRLHIAGAAVDAVRPWLLDSARQVMLLLTRRVSAPSDRR